MYYDYTHNNYKFDHSIDEYEQLIRKSPLFTYDKEMEISAYKKEAMKMVEYLYSYVMLRDKKCSQRYRHDEYAIEIVETAQKTISGYDLSKGEFINYFNVCWMQKQKSIAYDQFNESYKGITINKSEALEVSKYKKARDKVLAELGVNKDATDETGRLIATEMGIPFAKVQKYRWIVASAPLGEYTRDSNGETYLNSIEAAQGRGEVVMGQELESRPEDILLKPYKNNEYYERLETVFLMKQKRLQDILKVLITSEFYPAIVDDNSIIERIRDYSFFDEKTLKECVLEHKQKTHREIADQFERDEASISRTWSKFLESLTE